MTNHFEDVGAYLLGALEPDELVGFEHALETDEHLRAEVARLKVAADALPASPEQMTPPVALKGRIMAIVESEAQLLNSALPAPVRPRRQGWSWRPRLAIAAVALTCAVIGGVVVDAVVFSDRTVVTAEVGDARLIDKGDGQHATLEVADLDAPGFRRVYQVWLQHEGQDAPEPTNALFNVRSDGTASVDVPGSLEDVEAVLVTEEPEGGSQAPTTSPVIVARPA